MQGLEERERRCFGNGSWPAAALQCVQSTASVDQLVTSWVRACAAGRVDARAANRERRMVVVVAAAAAIEFHTQRVEGV